MHDFGNVLGGVNIAHDRRQIAARVNDERRALKTLPVFAANPVRGTDGAVRVRQQGGAQIIFLDKGLVAGQVVSTDADQNRFEGVELRFRITETDCFPRSPGGIVFGIEEQHDLATAELGEAEGTAGAGGQLEFRGRVSRPDFSRHC